MRNMVATSVLSSDQQQVGTHAIVDGKSSDAVVGAYMARRGFQRTPSAPWSISC